MSTIVSPFFSITLDPKLFYEHLLFSSSRVGNQKLHKNMILGDEQMGEKLIYLEVEVAS